MTGTPDDLRRTVDEAAARLRAWPAAAVERRPAPGRWSPKEIIGHLVDSASNNHQRFVRAQFRDDLRFDGYEQDDWVQVQCYASAPWDELLDLWQSYNRHLARIMAATPAAALRANRDDHNLHQIAWEIVPAGEPATLEYFMRDYVEHLKHHLRQIDPELAPTPTPQRASRNTS